MKKTILILVAAMSISCSAQKKFQYMPDYNARVIKGTISEKFRSTRSGHIFQWFKMGDTIIHVWDPEVYRLAKVGELISLKGIKKMTTNFDKNRIQ